MSDKDNERHPDPRVAFVDAAGANTGEADARVGTADRIAVAASADHHLPPLADEQLDARPLAQRFAEPEE
ncbi:hypothetical protein [Streptosporangium carneum]|uniref:Uncharacterized protein n=1 Tax=Streptosporangium carneum TaxID=47481 RepID=A0A9W6HZK7_9ACTN|nr:hypothetical protein [Streptosporangium carneum]GLK08706.1 hypothetical protein GCM10017600_21110 [Streptosporangium carneum]